MSASKESLYQRLRAETRALHEELEADVGIGDRLRSREAYASHLTQLWTLHRAVEAALSKLDFRKLGFVYPYPYRAALLEADLRALGIDPDILDVTAQAPRLPTLAAGLGCIYVVEGSAKGARAILPDIKARLGFDAEHGASFFAGRGVDGKTLWHAFLAALSEIPPASDEGDEACEAARATFAMFKVGLSGPGRVGTDASGLPRADRPQPSA